MNNWKSTISRINKDRYKIPAGWETREQVAKALECDPARVGDILKAGLASGEFERGEFPVWDEHRRLAVRVVCYRCKPDDKTVAKETKAAQPVAPKRTSPASPASGMAQKIRTSLANHPDWPDNRIAKNHKGCTKEMVAAERAKRKGKA